MPEYERIVSSGLIHPDHLGTPKIAAKPGLRFAEAGDWQPWVVKLKFVQGSESSGSGFFINIPGSSYDVILTAGHNLVDSNGKPSTDIRVLEVAGGSTEIRETPVNDSDVRVSKRYQKRPNDTNAANDYGAILLRRDGVGGSPPHPGFGFSLLLGIDYPDLLNTRNGKDPKDEYLTSCGVSVTGYKEVTDPGKPDVSTGRCTILPNQLEYGARTQIGLSGSPVWTSYGGLETVVAVHNHGDKGSDESSGTRLTLRVMQEVFSWAEIDPHTNKRLRIKQPGAHQDGLYLAFIAEGVDDEFVGRVHVGKPPDEVDTLSIFDVFLAEAPPTTRLAERQQRYALKAKDYWLLWDVRSQRVTLSSQFHPWCFVRLENADTRGGTFHLVIHREEENVLVRLKVDILGLTELHMMMGKRDVNGISFPRAIKGKTYKFDQFCLE
ncbi:hypothetical protein AAE478_000678 [Parahypoxylon ruwenzoriense]